MGGAAGLTARRHYLSASGAKTKRPSAGWWWWSSPASVTSTAPAAIKSCPLSTDFSMISINWKFKERQSFKGKGRNIKWNLHCGINLVNILSMILLHNIGALCFCFFVKPVFYVVRILIFLVKLKLVYICILYILYIFNIIMTRHVTWQHGNDVKIHMAANKYTITQYVALLMLVYCTYSFLFIRHYVFMYCYI